MLTSEVTGVGVGADRDVGNGMVMTVGDGRDAGADGEAQMGQRTMQMIQMKMMLCLWNK